MGNQRLTQAHALAQKSELKPVRGSSHKPQEEGLEPLQGLVSNRAVNQMLTAEGAGAHPNLRAPKPSFRGLSSEITGGIQPQGLIIQPKLVIGQPNDKYEQEADRVAEQVVQQLNAPKPVESNAAQTIQREVMPDEDEDKLQMKPMVQPQGGVGEVAATPELESSIQQMRGGGQPLPDSIREPMERSFGADFNRVRVHANTQADRLARSISSKAFTAGQDVFFREGTYTPYCQDGQELLAHELTHVMQQEDNVIRRTNGVTSTSDSGTGTAKRKSSREASKKAAQKFKSYSFTALDRFNFFYKGDSIAGTLPSTKATVSATSRFFDPSDSSASPYQNSSQPFVNQDYVDFIVDHIRQNYPNYEAQKPYNPNNDLSTVLGDPVFHVDSESGRYYVIIEPTGTEAFPDTYYVNDSSTGAPDQELKDAVNAAGGIDKFMQEIAQGKLVNGVDGTKLKALCMGNSKNEQYLAASFRFKANHEWVPSSYVTKVIERATDNGSGPQLAWIELQNTLASETKNIVFDPDRHSSDDITIDSSGKQVLQGHSGALYGKREADGKFIPLTKGQGSGSESPGTFHGDLRNAFNKNKQVDKCIAGLYNVFVDWVWDGGTVPSASHYHDEYYNKSGTIVDDLNDVADRQNTSGGYEEISDQFQAIYEKLTSNDWRSRPSARR